MKPLRWSAHALKNLADREIDRAKAGRTLAEPDLVAPAEGSRRILMRRYEDRTLGRQMLLRIVIEETDDENVVVTAYKTSSAERYLKGQVR